MSIPPNNRDVKSRPRRRYDATRRLEQAAQTRIDVLTAARELFPERGYAGTTINEIAIAAGVAVETIYRSFGSKAALFREVLEAAIAGGAERAAIPAEQRPAVRKMAEEPDPRRLLELHAATQPGIHARSGPYDRVLREAASADPDLADVWRQLEAQRLTGMRRLAQRLHDLGALRPGLSVEKARDILWTVNSHAVYDLLVVERGWPPERYRDWIVATNVHSLLVQP
ncbi:MAG TPA: helix-turn-helix domain-containing protein [Candidatus Dormibacteraeota bacterium]|nr:helix-turn-helix domain-containing protein [Candidatus Dormibacteraeota bacterium]